LVAQIDAMQSVVVFSPTLSYSGPSLFMPEEATQ